MSETSWINACLVSDLRSDRYGRAEVRDTLAKATARATGAAVVAPRYVSLAAHHGGEELTIISTAGFPTGRHHTLVTAAEARLAVSEGAEHIWVYVDPAAPEQNEILSELIAVREAVPRPGLVSPVIPQRWLAGEQAQWADSSALDAFVEACSLAGMDGLVVETDWADWSAWAHMDSPETSEKAQSLLDWCRTLPEDLAVVAAVAGGFAAEPIPDDQIEQLVAELSDLPGNRKQSQPLLLAVPPQQ